MRRLAFLALPILVLAGCASDNPAPSDASATKEPAPTGQEAPPLSDTKVATSQGKPGSGALVQVPPMMREQVDPAEAAKLTKDLADLKTAYDTAKAAYDKNPKDEKAKDAFITAGVKYGKESMNSLILPPRTKYKQALKIYREVLKVDPTNPIAKPDSDLIIGIYQEMHRPVPE